MLNATVTDVLCLFKTESAHGYEKAINNIKKKKDGEKSKDLKQDNTEPKQPRKFKPKEPQNNQAISMDKSETQTSDTHCSSPVTS